MKLQNVRLWLGRLLSRCFPMRIWICIMMFTACWTSYACRLQMPILVVPMIAEQPLNHTDSRACVFDESRRRRDVVINPLDPTSYLEQYVLDLVQEKRDRNLLHLLERRQAQPVVIRPPDAPYEFFSGLPFDWTPTIRGQLLAGYSYGVVPGNFLGGWLSMRYGPRRAILWTSVLAAIISLVSPFIAQCHWGLLMFSRVIIGLTGGAMFPSCHTMVAKWSHPNERARMIWSLLGGTFGTILTYPMIAGIAETMNWESGWYIPSLLMIIWTIVWALVAYDSPVEHPGISDEERDYILTGQAGIVRTEKPRWKQTPIKQILSSVPFLSLVVCHFGNLFLLFFYQNSLMLYLTKALGFELTKGGAAAGAPWGGRMLFGFFFSWAGDTIKRKKIISITLLRKLATIFSHFIPGIFLILVGYVGCDFVLANVFLFFALGFNGAALISNLSNNQDLAPNFAGFLYGIMNTIGSTSGMIIPPMVEEIAGKFGNPVDRWQILFWIGAGVSIGSMVVFLFGGSGNIQKWNELIPLEDPKENVEAGQTKMEPIGTAQT
ncbi:PREDICTED: putative inorganic phosphate cotransporter isoform X3 [Trachymyrmex septentrionalis]|uniref:putative inorganic phosphate cotransporter isoform X3 n=1 Tax=Trachymyrmex septentrionalis TaxID=34720 RepID=UPI00084F73F6|nr:PREDICTED: putative inorganic phosphate cotransporter isoform X3 [Trachymyrmex septentrionalis]